MTVSLTTTLPCVIFAGALIMWLLTTSMVLHLKFSILMSSSIWHHTNWWPKGVFDPSGKIFNATLIFCLAITSAHRVLASRARSCSTILEISIPNLLLFYLVCYFLMLATILSLFLSMCLSHQWKAGSWSISCAMANLAVCNGWDSFESDNFSLRCNCHYTVRKLANLQWNYRLPACPIH